MGSKDIETERKALYISGRFDDEGGRASKIAGQVFEEVKSLTPDIECYNGGSFQELGDIFENIGKYRLVYWFADVPNEKPKLVENIKRKNQACVLVTSKRNLDGNYGFQDLLYHALGIKSNLFVEITQEEDRYYGRIADPLGNVFLNYDDDFSLVGKVLGKRAKELLGCTRISSEKAGDDMEIPDKTEFFESVKGYADTFHDLIHARPEAANRFLGNASFRCESGFPSFKHDGLIFVSRRNVDKRGIGKDAFVPVQLEVPVKYYGNYKPSIDTPMQVKLYDYYPNVRYMLHSHAYVDGAPFTERIIPCGALEEVDEITSTVSDRYKVNFSVNLKGHGSLVLVDGVENLRKIPYVAREIPEIHLDYANDL